MIVGDQPHVQVYRADGSELAKGTDVGILNIVADIHGDGIPEMIILKGDGETLTLEAMGVSETESVSFQSVRCTRKARSCRPKATTIRNQRSLPTQWPTCNATADSS